MEEGPATIAAFIHVVALHEVLSGVLWDILAIFELQSWFNHLSEWHSVAGATSSLVSYWPGEVVSIDICIVVWFWNISVWNIISIFIFQSPWLCFFQDSLEFFWIIAKFRSFWLWFGGFSVKEFLGYWLNWLLSESLLLLAFRLFVILGLARAYLSEIDCLWLAAMSSIVSMVLLKFADICLPSKVIMIDVWDSQISLVRWDMLVMSIESSRGKSQSLHYFHLRFLF